MPDLPLVSIIIPTYNRAHLIGETLDSVLAQTYKSWECIVVDDGSTDDTEILMAEYCEKDDRLHYVHRPKERPRGGNAARNYGFEICNGEFVNWFDSDDIMVSNKIEIQMKALKEKQFNFSVCEIVFFENNHENFIEIQNKKLKSRNALFDFIRKEVVFFTPTPIFKKSFLVSHSLKFDEKLQSSQEWELFCRILYYSPNYHAISKPLVLVRKHKRSIRNDDNYELRKKNYFLSRNKVFFFLKLKKQNIPPDVEVFFINIFMKYYVEKLFKREMKQVIKLYFKNIYYHFSFLENMKILLYSFIVLTTGRGHNYRDRFLKK